MKKLLIVLSVMFLALSACTTVHVHHKRIPPGHAKKMTGEKSAKEYSPGHQKKKK